MRLRLQDTWHKETVICTALSASSAAAAVETQPSIMSLLYHHLESLRIHKIHGTDQWSRQFNTTGAYLSQKDHKNPEQQSPHAEFPMSSGNRMQRVCVSMSGCEEGGLCWADKRGKGTLSNRLYVESEGAWIKERAQIKVENVMKVDSSFFLFTANNDQRWTFTRRHTAASGIRCFVLSFYLLIYFFISCEVVLRCMYKVHSTVVVGVIHLHSD